MKHLQFILQRARSSACYLWLFNRVLWRMIPFNRPHRARIISIYSDQVTVLLPFRRSNRNHLRGMHACALATLCEYACGIGLITRLDPARYRIILRSIQVDYHMQARTDVVASFFIDEATLRQTVITPLETSGSITETFTVDAFDDTHKKICTAQITWQLKNWELVNKHH